MRKNIGIIALMITVLSFSRSFAQDVTTKATPTQVEIYDNILVKRVIAGDILELDNGEEVQLIGVDCSEANTQEGQKAIEFMKSLVEGREIRLEFDVEKRDESDRLSAYVFIDIPFNIKSDRREDYYYSSNDVTKYVFVNATIIKAGYASPVTIPPNVKYVDLFQKLYQEARENKRGLWSE